MSGDGGRAARLRHGRATRLLLSLLFLVHWGAVAVFLLPSDEDTLAAVPAPLRPPLAAVVVPLARRSWPAARLWLDATSTRQHWTLFAPDPADWSAAVEAVVYRPEPRRGEPPGWRADTLRLPGPGRDPFPHWTGHRPYRIIFNLGYEDWGAFYRPLLARRLCRDLAADGPAPAGVALFADWAPLDPPWAEPRAPSRQALGGYSCWAVLGEPRPPALPGTDR